MLMVSARPDHGQDILFINVIYLFHYDLFLFLGSAHAIRLQAKSQCYAQLHCPYWLQFYSLGDTMAVKPTAYLSYVHLCYINTAISKP